MANTFKQAQKLLRAEIRADRPAVLNEYFKVGSQAVEALSQIINDPASSVTQRLQAISELFSIPTRVARLNESSAARDLALAKVRQCAVDLIKARAREKEVTRALILEDKRLARKKAKAKKEREKLFNIENLKRDGVVVEEITT
jgi:hypothetical protein